MFNFHQNDLIGMLIFGCLRAGLPPEVSCGSGRGNMETGRAGEEDRTSRGWLQALLGSSQSGKTGTHKTHTQNNRGALEGFWGRQTESVRAGLQRISNEKFKELCLYLLKGNAVMWRLFLKSTSAPSASVARTHTHTHTTFLCEEETGRQATSFILLYLRGIVMLGAVLQVDTN